MELEGLMKLFGFSITDLLSYGTGIYFVVESLKAEFPTVFVQKWLKKLFALALAFGLGAYLHPGAIVTIIAFGILTFSVASGANRMVAKSGGKVGSGVK